MLIRFDFKIMFKLISGIKTVFFRWGFQCNNWNCIIQLIELDNVKREMENVDKYFVGTKNSHFCLPLALLWPYRVAPFNLSLNNFGVYVNQS